MVNTISLMHYFYELKIKNDFPSINHLIFLTTFFSYEANYLIKTLDLKAQYLDRINPVVIIFYD